SSFILVELKPMDERKASTTDIVNRLREPLSTTPGARMFMVPQQDIPVGSGGGGRSGSYDYSLLGSDLELLKTWLPKVQQAMAELPELVDVDTGTDDKAGLVQLEIDRDMASRLGIDMAMVAGTLNNSFSQRQVSTIYGRLNQYYVVLEVEPRFAQDLESLKEIEVVAKDGTRVPLSAFTRFSAGTAPRSINHTGLLVAESVSFDLAEGVTLSEATAAIEQAMARIQLPTREIQAGFEGNTAQMLDALAKQPLMF